MDRNQLLNDPETAMRYALDGRQSTIWTAMPGIVAAVDLAAMTLQVQPAIQGLVYNSDESTQYVNLPLLVDVPICFPSAGGFSLTLPIAVGDEVLVVIASRCIDAWWQLGGVQLPIEMRMHDLSDGFAIPGPRSQPRVVEAISSTNAQLRNDAGTVYLEITPAGGVNIVAPSGMMITSPTVTMTGNLVVEGAATVDETLLVTEGLTVNGNSSLEGTVDCAGALDVGGEVSTPQIIVSGIAFTSHEHGGVTTGSGNTGVPI